MAVNFNCELLDLRSFLAIHEARSFNRAAVILNISQPALSRRIQRLESLVGGALFDRSSRRLAETALGRELLPIARDTLQRIDSSLFALPNLRQPRWTDLTIACVQTAALHMLSFAAQHFVEANRLVRLRIRDVPAVEATELVARGEAEFGICIDSLMPPNLVFEPLCEDAFGLVCHRNHPLVREVVVEWPMLHGEKMIAVHRASRNRTLLEAHMLEHGLTYEWRYEVGHVTTALGLIEAGVGIAILPRMAVPQSLSSNIVWRSLVEPVVSRTIGIIRRRTGSIHPAAKQLLDDLRRQWVEAGVMVKDAVPESAVG